MKIEQSDIEELEAEIILDRKEIALYRKDLTEKEGGLAEKEAVLRFMKKRGTSGTGVKQPRVASSRAGDVLKSAHDIIDLSDIEIGVKVSSGVTLADNIKALIERMGEQEFIIPQIEALLKAAGNAPGGKSPRARIAMIMSALERDGVVIRTFRGKGSVPHKFKKAKNAQEAFGDKDESFL